MIILHTFSLVISDVFFFFKQETAYEMRISDWSSDVCSSDLLFLGGGDAIDHLLARDDQVGMAFAVGLAVVGEAGARLVVPGRDLAFALQQIGRASCRERVCQYV